MADKNVSIQEMLWVTFPEGFERKKYCSLWQAIFHVMEQECPDEEYAFEFAEALANIEGYFLDTLVEEHRGSDLSLFDKKGNKLSHEGVYSQLSGGDFDVFMSCEDGKHYLTQLNEFRFEVVEQFKAAYVIYVILMIQIDKAINRAGPILSFKPFDLPGLDLDKSYGYLIGKGSLKKWKEVLLSDSATLVNSIMQGPKRSDRSDMLGNYQKIIGLMVHLLSKILPVKYGLNMEESSDKKAARFAELLARNVNEEQSNFPKMRTLKQRLGEGMKELIEDIETTEHIHVQGEGGWETIEEPLIKMDKTHPKKQKK